MALEGKVGAVWVLEWFWVQGLGVLVASKSETGLRCIAWGVGCRLEALSLEYVPGLFNQNSGIRV